MDGTKGDMITSSKEESVYNSISLESLGERKLDYGLS